MKKLADYRESLERCVRCNSCQAACPTYRAAGREPSSARGRASLIRAYLDEEIALTDEYIKHIRECLVCGACNQSCPNGVDVAGAVLSARADYVEKQGMSLFPSIVIKKILDSKNLMPLTLRLGSVLQGIFFRDSSSASGLVSRFPLPLVGDGRLVPSIAKTFFLDLPGVRSLDNPKSASEKKTARVVFFAGCGINYLLPEVGEATLRALERRGVQVIVPRAQVCCGMPALSSGDVETAKDLAGKNFEIIKEIDADYITTSCATCTHALKKVFEELLADEVDGLKDFSERVKDITELLSILPDDQMEKPTEGPITVTYHDPCHLARYLGIKDEPRELLLKKGLELREMRHPCSCCGLGGGVGFTNYELSMEVAEYKAENIKESGAEIVATACPGCMVQLKDSLHRFGVNAKVKHVVELL